ncbi:MAG TPA: amidohydrolase family protein [Terriglobales bacterium]|nr:amidohydrolase family protein [Terriglobales bacterium]
MIKKMPNHEAPQLSQHKKAIWAIFSLDLLVLCLVSGCLIDRIGGAFSKPPEDLERSASKKALDLIEHSYADLDPARIVDHHVHIIAIGTSVSDAFVNPRTGRGLNLDRLKFQIYASASGIKDLDHADSQYIERLVRLARAIRHHGKYQILALDKHYKADGTVDLDKTTLYVPNHYVVELAEKYPDVFAPVISVHPHRADALQELAKWAKAGVKYVKWLPNAMGMDPANPSIDRFYLIMKQYRMILLSHTGEEQAVEAKEDQHLGNPLLLRRPLDLGLRVIMAHSASLGTCDDLDHGAGKTADCFDLFYA